MATQTTDESRNRIQTSRNVVDSDCNIGSNLIPILLSSMPRSSDQKPNLRELFLRSMLLVMRRSGLDSTTAFFAIYFCFASYTDTRQQHITPVSLSCGKMSNFAG
jgi:hypothetical protein